MAKSTRYVLSTNAHDGGDDRSDEARFGQKVTVLANGCWAWRNDLTQYGHFKRSTAGCDGPQGPKGDPGLSPVAVQVPDGLGGWCLATDSDRDGVYMCPEAAV